MEMGHRINFIKQRIFSFLRKKIMGKYALGVIYNTRNGLLAAPIDDVSVGKALGFKGVYDTLEIKELEHYLSKNDIVYVVGTHIGALLIPLAKSCKEVIGYEANPETFNYLTTNLHLNAVGNARVFNYAVGDSARKIEFYQNRLNSGGSKIKPKTDHYFYNYDSPRTIEVTMICLDEHIKAEKLPDANGIIMDIEGAEFYALQGMKELIRKSRFLYIEYVPHHLENVSSVSNKDFFDLILPYYGYVKFMRNYPELIDLKTNSEHFIKIVNAFRENGTSDDLLFLKTEPNAKG